MPYIDRGTRADLDPILEEFRATLLRRGGLTEGEVNYLVSSMVKEIWDTEPKYHTIARVTGVLENVKQEFYRRMAVPYEEEKILENGDIY